MPYFLPDIEKFDDLIQELENNNKIDGDSGPSENLTFFETFDWRLYRRNLVLFQKEGQYFLKDFKTGAGPAGRKLRRTPRFSSDIPQGELKDTLEPVMEMRALLPLMSITKNTRILKILNKDQKTILRLVLSENIVSRNSTEEEPFFYLSVQPLRGYEKIYQFIQDLLTEHGIVEQDAHEFSGYCRQLNLQPGAYTSKIKLNFEQDICAGPAAVSIYKYLLEIMEQNEAGICDDLDSEFLHDFRVSVRRTRSALGQLKQILPMEKEAYFKSEFSYLGKLSNRLRDLDVYLLDEDNYRSMLPEGLRDSINPLFQRLRRERGRERRKFVNALNSQRVQKLKQDWREFLDTLGNETDFAEKGQLPALQLARKVIYKRYKKIIAAGSEITDQSPPQMLHDLRIECKKLRYSLEFFASLFPAEKISFLIKQLKKLQDNLGTFNDVIIQQEMLKGYLDQIKNSDPSTAAYAGALGCLIGILWQKEKQVRDNFSTAFTIFCAKKNQLIFKELFKAS